MPTVDIGKVRPTFVGEWDENTAYEAVTVVMFEGTAYQSAMNTPAGALPTAPNSVYWFPIGWRGKKGEDGEPGKPGDDGKPGPPGPTMPISNSVTSPDSGVAASSMAVKTAYDVATGAQTTANTAQSTATTAQGTANTANTNAANAQTTANTANSTANTAQTTANSAQVAFNNLSAPIKQNWQWSDPGDLPSYLWGSSDGQNHRVYPPSRLNVNYANSAGYAASAGYAPSSGAPMPQNTNYGAVGYITGAQNAGALPAGGTWVVFGMDTNTGTTVPTWTLMAGGSMISRGYFAWRIA